MKPLKLKFQAFGSFPGLQEIDFTSLAPRGLFVVSGDTGTGKTTIFDAMCWALYGVMPLKEASGARSHHAADGVETFVELTFECEGDLYIVTRRPEQLRPAKVGQGMVRDDPKATLVQLTAEGHVPLATTASGVSKRCVELVGLDAEQFQRVMLLPQGEFARFLLAGSTEREGLLGQLFGGAVFDRIVEELKKAAAALKSQLGAADAEIDTCLANARGHVQRVHEQLGLDAPEVLAEADRDTVAQLRESATPALEALGGRVIQLRSEADALVEARQLAGASAARFDQAAELRTRLAKLNEAQSAIDAGMKAAEASAAARPVAVAADTLVAAEALLAKATTDRDHQIAIITDAFAELGATVDATSVTAINDLLTTHRRRHDTDRQALDALAAARKTLGEAQAARAALDTEVTAATTDLATVAERLDAIVAALPTVSERAIDLDGIQTQIATATAHVTTRSDLEKAMADLGVASAAEVAAVAAYDAALAGFVATQAPRLATELIDGEPCPVCGATEHPAPAAVSDGEPTTYELVEREGKAKEVATAAAKLLHDRVTELRSGLGDAADLGVDELRSRVAELADLLTQAEAAHAELAALTNEREAGIAHRGDLEKLLAGLAEKVAAADRAVADKGAAVTTAEDAAEGIDTEHVARTAAALPKIDAACTDLEVRFTAVTAATGEVTNATTTQATALLASPFDDVEGARAALLPADGEQAHRDAAAAHGKELAEVGGALDALNAQGVPDERPDTDAAQAAADAAVLAHDAQAEIATTARNAHADAETTLLDHDQLLSDSGDLRARHERADAAWRICNKGGALGMPLKRWVLGRELDRVTAAANVHLARMTGHRYSLHRKQEITDGRTAFGLDLEVLASDTGRPRSTRSLSGGEQFQASLALALGLADVVSHGGSASGKRFEALFVDEGFGSLDPVSLDEAIAALHQLHATGRMVGAITHVEEMKKQLHVGIEVTRLPDGGGSTLVVHP